MKELKIATTTRASDFNRCVAPFGMFETILNHVSIYFRSTAGRLCVDPSGVVSLSLFCA